MIKNKMEEMTKIQSSYGNYGFGLGQIIREHAGIQNGGQAGELEDGKQQLQAEEKENFVMPPNSIAIKNGIWDEEGLRQISGWREPFKSETLLSTLRCLEEFHREMETVIEAKKIHIKEEALVKSYEKLLTKVSHYVHRGSQWYSSMHFHRKEEKAMLPAMSTMLIKLYSLGNVFDNINNLALDYMVEHGKTSASVSEIIIGKMAQSLQGTMSSVTEQSGQIDKTAYQMRKRSSKKEQFSSNDEIKARRLPSLNDKSGKEELRRLAVMIEGAELRAENNLEREQYKIDYGDLLKMIYILLSSTEGMSESGISWKKKDIEQAQNFWNKTEGMTVGEALKEINRIRIDQMEYASSESIKAGGAMSGVLLDKQKKRVLRTSENQQGVEEKRDNNNYNYDEAMSRLAEVTGLKSQVGARTTYYKDMEGNLQYGTNMELASGESARDAKMSFGDKETDDRMRGGRYNIFDSSTPEKLRKNGDMIISSFQLQILDYISSHKDRHDENIFIDLNANNPMQSFMGIDNDNVFGKGTNAGKESRKVENKEHVLGEYERKDAEKKPTPYMDLTTLLEGFDIIPNETKKQIEDLDTERINEALKPYLDRSARFAAVNRVRKLKEYVGKKSKIVDVRTVKGMETFKKETLGRLVTVALEVSDGTSIMGGAGNTNSIARAMPSILMRVLAMQYFNMAPKLIEKNGSYDYLTEFEYVKEGEEKTYITKANKAARQEAFWRTYDAMIRVSGKTREEVWNEAVERKFGEHNKHLESDRDYQIIKDRFLGMKENFLAGKAKMFLDMEVR